MEIDRGTPTTRWTKDEVDRNEEIQQLLELWMWCSRSLHVKWERIHKHRNTCLMALHFAVNESRSGKKIGFSKLCRAYQSLPVPMFNDDGLIAFCEIIPSVALQMATGCFTKGSPLTDELDQIRQKHGINPTLDALFKKMSSREKRYGPDWIEEGYHPESEFAQLKKEIAPLCDDFERVILLKIETMDLLARKIFADGGWQVPKEIPATWLVRKTPESLLNRATRLKLWQVAQEISFRNLDEEAEVVALCDAFYSAITPAVKEAVEAQGYTIDDVVNDFLNYDRYKSREEITGEPPR